MKSERWIDAITQLEPDILERYFEVKNKMVLRAKRKKMMKWSSMAAACLICCVCVIQIVNFIYNGTNSTTKPTSPGITNGTSQSQGSVSFQTYEEMLKSIMSNGGSQNANGSLGSTEIFGDTYFRFLKRIVSDKSVTRPMQNGEPMPYQNKEGFSNITFFPREWCDMPWIWYFCSVGNETVTVRITYPDCVNEDIDYSKNCSEILKELNPNAVNIYNYRYYRSYKNVSLQTVRIASGEVSALIYEYKNEERVSILYCFEGAMIFLDGSADVLNEAFLQSFSMSKN